VTEHRITIPIKPRPKGRPRFARGRAYTPPETVAFEHAVGVAWLESGGPCFDGPVEVELTFTKDSIEVCVRALDADRKSPLRGDVDNYAKSVLDGLNVVAFGDDRRVLRLTAEKR
jgi:Holliday junction resolvase RusA-like endonuclease